jgi:hypothetical protein
MAVAHPAAERGALKDKKPKLKPFMPLLLFYLAFSFFRLALSAQRFAP